MNGFNKKFSVTYSRISMFVINWGKIDRIWDKSGQSYFFYDNKLKMPLQVRLFVPTSLTIFYCSLFHPFFTSLYSYTVFKLCESKKTPQILFNSNKNIEHSSPFFCLFLSFCNEGITVNIIVGIHSYTNMNSSYTFICCFDCS